MPTINQLPSATAITGADLLPLSQGGMTRSVAVSTLLATAQPTISVAQNSLLGRSSPGQGAPEAIKIGTGLSLLATSLTSNGQDHLGLVQATGLAASDELVINSGGVPKRVVASGARSLFSGGTGVTIDQNGVISVTSGANGVGAQGPKGDPGTAGQGFNFRNGWQPATSYAPYDVVVTGGQTYVATASFVSGNVFDPTKWTLIAAQGAIGPTGAQGLTGSQGSAGPIVPATSISLGAVKPGGGLSVASDGTLSIGSVNLATLAQNGAATGQVLGWTGTGWGPTSGTSAGVAAFNGRVGSINLTTGDVTVALGTGATARAALGLATIASSGAFADLSGTPVIPAPSSASPLMSGVAAAGIAAAFARADHVHPSDTSRIAVANNLSDLSNTTAARANLGLGASATMSVGTVAGTVAAGNDSRLAGALQPAAIPSAAGQLLVGSGTAGTAAAVSIGTGLSLSGGTLNATVTSSYSLPPATTTTLGGVKPDGATLTATADGTLVVNGLTSASLADITTIGGPSLSDIDVLSRGTSDYKVTLSARVTLFRKTPAGSRTIMLSAGATAATLTAADHDKTVVVSGSVAGSLAVDGTITDGFRCQVINHTGSALIFSGINGLLGASSLSNNASCWVSLSNATVEASVPGSTASTTTPGGSNGQLQVNNSGSFGGVTIGSGLSLAQGTLTATAPSYSLPAATTTNLGGVKVDGATVTAAADGTLSVPGVSLASLTDISTLGGPSSTDIDLVNRSGTDYRTTLAARAALFRKTPAGSRTVTFATGAATATLTAADHDKTVVLSGSAPGSLTTDGTITDGFFCRVINHSGSPATFSGINGLAGATSLPSGAMGWVTLSNSTFEASVPILAAGGSSGQLQANAGGALSGIAIGAGLSLANSTLSATYSYTLPVASTQSLGGVKQGTGVSIAADGTISATGSSGVSTFNARTGAVSLTLGDVTTVTGIGASAQTSFGLGSSALLGVGATAGTVAAGNDARLVGALQSSAIPAATGQLLGGSGTAGSAQAVAIGAGLSLSAGTLSATSTYTLPSASSTVLGGVKQGSGVNIAADGTLSVPAYLTAGVAGVVNSLPGGGGATVFRYVFVRPCLFSTNLVSPYPPQMQAVIQPAANASFGLSKRTGAGALTPFGTITIAPAGTITASTTATSFAPGDELVITAPSPADPSLADVSLTFTGTWG